MIPEATVVGAGLAGCEAAWQLARRGIRVRLCEMKPVRFSPAHHDSRFAELVCSNSLRSDRLTNAVGLLKQEMRLLDSLIIRCADGARVPAGGALAVDRSAFMEAVTAEITVNPLIEVRREVVESIPPPPAIIATGPLTDGPLAEAIAALPGMKPLYFFDAAAPIVTAESLDMSRIFRQSRYGRGDDYLNCPMSREQYDGFYDALIAAQTAPVHDFDAKHVFEGCMAVELLAARGRQTLAFGTMKPVGLIDPRTGRQPYAVVQLRQDDAAASLYNLVGFQTRLKWGEQRRVFSMIPGLERAQFARYGLMHRNTYLHSPGMLGVDYALLNEPMLCFAGQITGVEGYVESAASGLVAGLNLARRLRGLDSFEFGGKTAIGSLSRHITAQTKDFQPMNATFGLLDPLPERIRGKAARYEALAKRAIELMEGYARELSGRDE